MAKINYLENAGNFNQQPTNSVNYFHLNDGEEAIVRFNYSTPQEMEAETTHSVPIGKSYRRVSCLRSNGDEPLHLCPLCASNTDSLSKVQTRFFVKLIQYTTDETGKLVIKPAVWDKPAGFIRELKAFMDEYGDLRSVVFKVKRTGATLNDTRYNVIVANQSVYTAQAYPIDFSSFNNFDLYERHCLGKTAEEMTAYLQTGNFPLSNTSVPNTATRGFDMNPVQPAVQPIYVQQAQPIQPAYAQPVQQAYPNIAQASPALEAVNTPYASPQVPQPSAPPQMAVPQTQMAPGYEANGAPRRYIYE